MPEGIPARLPALLWLAIEHRWAVTIRPVPSGAWLRVRFERAADALEIVWLREAGGTRLGSCDLLGQADPETPGYRKPSKRMLLRDVPSILRGGGS